MNNNSMSSSKILLAFVIIIIAGHPVEGDSRKLRHRTSSSNAFTWQVTTKPPAKEPTITLDNILDDNDNEEDSYQSRIVGGVASPVDAYPFYANWGGQCGASLVAREWLLSAAHCDPISTQNVRINRSRGIGYTVGRGDLVTMIDRFPHPSYNGNTHDNDIMLMRLAEPVMDHDPIPLNFNDNVPSSNNNQDLKVIGFGRLESGGSSPNTLQEVVVQYVDTDTCNEPGSYGGSVNDDTMFCAGVPGGGKDSCQGDSGGPIFTIMNNDDDDNGDNNNSYSQVGVVSWGRGCARPDKPGVYARVSQYEQWIKDLICNDEEHYTQYKPDFCNNNGNNNNDGGFTWPVAPPPAANRPPTGGDVVEIQLRITYDDYPDETSWSFEQYDNVEVAKGDGTSSFPGDQSTYTYELQPGPAVFRIKDTMQDGICCGYGIGSYEIVAVMDGQPPISIVEDRKGDFGASEQVSFVVPGSSSTDNDDGEPPTPPQPTTRPPTSPPTTNNPPTRPPTSQPTTTAPTTTIPDDDSNNNCQDSSSTFYVDSNVGNRDCDWLSSNTDNSSSFQYLCQFFDVANKCKVTCDVCQYFEEYAANNQ